MKKFFTMYKYWNQEFDNNLFDEVPRISVIYQFTTIIYFGFTNITNLITIDILYNF